VSQFDKLLHLTQHTKSIDGLIAHFGIVFIQRL